MIYIGIDPGKKGGIAATSGAFCSTSLMPETTTQVLREIKALHRGLRCTAVIEKVQVMGKAFGAKAALSYGQGYGEIIGILIALEIKVIEVAPSVWKKAMGLTKEKDDSIALCERLFPNVCLLPTVRCKKPSDGMAEALLLAEYGRRNNL